MRNKSSALALATDICFCNICMRINDCNDCEFKHKDSVIFQGYCELSILNKKVERYFSKKLFDKVYHICASSRTCAKCEFNNATKLTKYTCMICSMFINICTNKAECA